MCEINWLTTEKMASSLYVESKDQELKYGTGRVRMYKKSGTSH